MGTDATKLNANAMQAMQKKRYNDPEAKHSGTGRQCVVEEQIILVN